MVSGSGDEKGGGSDKQSAVGQHHGSDRKHSVPADYKQEHEHRGYAYKGAGMPERKGHPFWHPSPKDLPEPPVHFQHNPVNLELHLGDPRQRLAGMTDAERAWRKKFVMDQHLAPEEPVYVPQFQGNFNPFRRIYRLPWDTLERRVLIPTMGYTYGHYFRAYVPKFFFGFLGFLYLYYHIKYHHPTWLDFRRMKVMRIDQLLLREEEIRRDEPGLIEKGFRNYQTKTDYYDLDFKQRWTHLKLDPPVRP